MEFNLLNKDSRYSKLIIIIILILVVLGLLTFANYRFAKDNPGGNDFLVHWMGTRTFLLDGTSPYSDETAVKIQTFAYGHKAEEGEHELRVAYPLYSMIVFAPFSLVKNYDLARALWMTTLELSLLALSYLSLKITDWSPGKKVLLAFFLFSIFWYHALRPLINGNVVIIIALVIAGVLISIKMKQDELAGVLLALTTIKPQVSIVFIIFIFVWAFRNKRLKVVGWFLASVFLLSLSAALLIPDWILQNLREIVRYPGYNPPGTPASALRALMPDAWGRVGMVISGLMILMLIFEWAVMRNEDYKSFLWIAFTTLTASQWIGIQTDPGNFIVLFPAIVFLFSVWEKRWARMGHIMIVSNMVVIFLGLWILFLKTVEYGYQPQQSPIMFFPLPGYLLLMLYWIRWWTERPDELWYERISAKGNDA